MTKVVVIGAGIAGLKAAIDLEAAGVETIILEARDRLGGRLHTIQPFGNGFNADMGASWFHDCLVNPLLKKNVGSPDVTYYFNDGDQLWIGPSGVITKNDKVLAVQEEMVTFMNDYYQDPSKSDMSLRNFAHLYLEHTRGLLTDKQVRYSPQAFRVFELWLGQVWDTLSSKLLSEEGHVGRNAYLTSGYKSVFEKELEEYPGWREKIKLNTVVSKIAHNDKIQKVNVITTGGSSYECDYTVVTIPLGVLQLSPPEKGAVQWDPPLPSSFSRNLEKTTFAALGKIFVEFEEVFWPKDHDTFIFLGEPDNEMTQAFESRSSFKAPFQENDYRLTKDPKKWEYPLYCVNLDRASEKPVLVLLTQNPLTAWIEEDPTSRAWPVIQPMMESLAKLTGKACPSSPKALVTSQWTQDPFARGSYMGCAVGDEMTEAIQAFIDPKEIFGGSNRVRFAGEHTVFEGSGCAHGAWNSGAREAKKIVELINGKASKL
ncbi:unnamed protein product [Kuraishia capsulata CBS 1993]|uniref:Amine oxidase domain-containing protein n=1 Tax=Kuraishia capsulata CBS 1993 TaxID=1382522 RepID=W6MXN6_9ASCO|nr:uncharacterized protein KUCA_T00005193001 [Kuraishia capsulata CBS 1993]CDK29205.1 unnamed protein product [Kuraishia capsulata CBS 1993]